MLSTADTFATVVGLAVSAVSVFIVVSFITIRFYETFLTSVYSAEARIRRLKARMKAEEVALKAEESLA